MLPKAHLSGGVIAAHDITGNGELELFIGGRLNPGNYPLPGTSQLLVKEDGVYKDRIDEWMPGLKNIGMVKAAQWADLNNDGQVELIVTGEFMSIHIYEKQGEIWKDESERFGTAGYEGWWNTIEVKDLNQDGYLEIIVGNLGLNSRYKASETYPLRIYASDYDANGSIDAVMSYANAQGEFIIHDKTTLSQQINAIRKKFPKNINYAESSLKDVIPQSELEESYRLEAVNFSSGTFLNQSGRFNFIPFPIEAQFSPINELMIDDINEDGFPDILTGGNSFAPEVFNGRYDAQASLLMLGKGNGHFIPITQKPFHPY